MMSNTKQYIIIRKDLKMRRGKEIAQGSHASIAFLTRRLNPDAKETCTTYNVKLSQAEEDWIAGSFTKVCLTVNSEEELDEIASKAKAAGLEVHVITDSGKTEFNGVATKTCLAIGPDDADLINPITGHLSLY